MAIEANKKNWWKRKSGSQKVSFVISCLIFVVCIVAFFLCMEARAVFGDEVGDKLFGEGVANGWAAIGSHFVSGTAKWVLSFVIITISFAVIFVGSFITHLFDNHNRRAKTIASLIRSLIKYIVIIVCICLILIVWGVDVVGVVAGVGILTLIIGLGCQTLIQDIISGLFIVFDDYFQVGDTVIIDGFRGTITEVGLKTTKIQDFGGNIKSITNSSISTVVNMSRLRSVVSVTLSISYNEDVERVEAIIINRIKELKNEIPNIIDGPWYKGIDAVNTSSIDLLVICFTQEANRFQVTRDLKREFYLLFKKHDIQIPFTQITVNQEDEKVRQQASKEEIAVALNEQMKLKNLDKQGKKKERQSLKKKIQTSLERTKDDMDR